MECLIELWAKKKKKRAGVGVVGANWTTASYKLSKSCRDSRNWHAPFTVAVGVGGGFIHTLIIGVLSNRGRLEGSVCTDWCDWWSRETILVARGRDGNDLESAKWERGSSGPKTEDDDTGRVEKPPASTEVRGEMQKMLSVSEGSLPPPSSPLFSAPSAALVQRKSSLRDRCWPWNSDSASKSLKANPHYKCQSGRVVSNFFFFQMISFTATHTPWSGMKYLWEHGEDNNV